MDLPVQRDETHRGCVVGFANGEGWGGDRGVGDPGALVLDRWSCGLLNIDDSSGNCGGCQISDEGSDSCGSDDSALAFELWATDERKLRSMVITEEERLDVVGFSRTR